MTRRSDDERILCAELLTIHWMDEDGAIRSEAASLEDISSSGACIHLEHTIPIDTQVLIEHSAGCYPAKVKYCVYQEIGYFLGVGFDEGYRWSKADFWPSHLLEMGEQL